MTKKYFFGWENWKWLIKELIAIYSSTKSYFSKKRVESGIAFGIAQWGMIFFLLKKYENLSMTDFLIWAGVEFAVSGYMISQIQKEKATKPETPSDEIA